MSDRKRALDKVEWTNDMIKCGNNECGACMNPDYEPADRLFLYKFLHHHQTDKMAFIDIGAHAGLYINYMEAMCRETIPDCKMISIEPNVAMLEILHLNTFPNHVLYIALWNKESVVFLHQGKPASSSGYVNSVAGDDGIPIMGISFDKVCRLLSLNATTLALKIDVEGAEGKVIEGCLETLQTVKHGVIVMEMCQSHFDRYDTDLEKIVNDLANVGYRPVRQALLKSVQDGKKHNVHFAKGYIP